MQSDVAKHCSEPFLAGNFKAKCIAAIGTKNVNRERKETTIEDIMVYQITDEETAKDVLKVCDPANLKCPLEDEYEVADNDSLKSITPKQCPLQSVRLSVNAERRSIVMNQMFTIWETTKDNKDEKPTDLEDGTVLLSALVYHPTKQLKEQAYMVIAGQNLTVLKDVIQCASDHAVYSECSYNPTGDPSLLMKKNSSGFFFIEGTFYNDMRDPYNRDYSTAIIEWAKTSFKYTSRAVGSFRSKRMEDTKFEELKIRLGYPYYYCHQGNCEHVVIFDDMRLLHMDDPKCMSMYPYRTYKKLPKRRKCSICELFTSKWITTNDALAFEDPSFFCAKCFDLLHYDENKKKLHPFESYHFDGAFNP